MTTGRILGSSRRGCGRVNFSPSCRITVAVRLVVILVSMVIVGA